MTTFPLGELFKIGIVKATTIFSCFQYLVGNEKTDWKEQNDEQSIELLCKLLHTVGHQLDLKPGKHKGQLEDLFTRLQEMSTDKKLPTRARFAVQEVLELRRNGWHERRVEEGPKLVSEIRMIAAQEERQQLAGMRSQRQRSDRGFPIGRENRDARDIRENRHRKDDGKNEVKQAGHPHPTKIITKDSSKEHKVSFREPNSHEASIELVRQPVPHISLSGERMIRRVKEMVEEYISNKIMQDAVELMEELDDASGPLVTCIIDRYLNSSKIQEKERLEELLDEMAPRFLLKNSSSIIAELSKFETLIALTEVTLDVKEVRVYL